ncbi:hypothetical protein T492DRAFT_1026238 [Pavlovales sp. CCMP2436]|nr:hypothetical protein T492DRAFT_1026238 [Pavlovales sp. CCMP2436]
MATRYKSKFWSHAFENAKVVMYVVTPIIVTVVFSQPAMVEAIVTNRMYVIYPPEGERPPPLEDMRERMAQVTKKRDEQQARQGA